ncbi:MAG TPA: nuclear transport factor 2 family protein [Opitutaceae bacterium]|jgi:ketosteroid isomerase-like protein|nr:nuclear transport factor 2 family protein [Opitutaceae bacterium]
MRKLSRVLLALLLATGSFCHAADARTEADSLRHATQAIRDAFARGDVETIVALHHPDIVKYFGGSNVISGRVELRDSLVRMFRAQRMIFVENRVESTVFVDDTAIETGIFGIKIVPKSGGTASLVRGRSMVVYIRAKESPTGWLTLREMTQAAPEDDGGASGHAVRP